MKKIILTIVSLFLSLYVFCQECFLHLKTEDTLKFQMWYTLYASFYDDTVIIKDTHGAKYKFVLDKDGYGDYGSDMVISDRGYFHACGDYNKGTPCRNGKIIMGDMMKLYFNSNSHVYNSNHRDHGSHMPHYSSIMIYEANSR